MDGILQGVHLFQKGGFVMARRVGSLLAALAIAIIMSTVMAIQLAKTVAITRTIRLLRG